MKKRVERKEGRTRKGIDKNRSIFCKSGDGQRVREGEWDGKINAIITYI